MSNNKAITIEHNMGNYFVKDVTNSVAYDPGQKISKQDVESLCKNSRWKVKVIKDK